MILPHFLYSRQPIELKTIIFENFSAKMLADIKKSTTFAVAIAKNTFSKAPGEVGEWLKPAVC